MKEIGEADFVVPRGIRQTQSVANIAKETSCKIHGSQRSAVGSVPDFFRKCDDHHAQRRTQRGAHRGAADLLETAVPMENWVIFKDIRMMRSMSRMKIFLVTLSVRHVRPLTTSPVVLPGVAFTEMILSGSVLMRVERNCKVSRQLAMKRSVSMLVKKTSKILVMYTRGGERVEVGVLEDLDEVEDISFCQVVGKRLGQ